MPCTAFLSATSELSCQCVSQSAVAFPNNMPRIAFLSATSELSCQCVSQSAVAFPNNVPRIAFLSEPSCQCVSQCAVAFPNNMPRTAFLSATSELSCQWVSQSAIAFPNRTTHAKKSTKSYASISTGVGAAHAPQARRNGAETVPQPCRTKRSDTSYRQPTFLRVTHMHAHASQLFVTRKYLF